MHFLRSMFNSEKRIQLPAGSSRRAENPHERSEERLSAAPRKAKCLERKSTAPLTSKNDGNLNNIPAVFDDDDGKPSSFLCRKTFISAHGSTKEKSRSKVLAYCKELSG
ncbi:hypothetical protein CYJ37_11070 [Bacillus sp. UMB0728]|nr:hypothetical protein CYJ37_11070 [Bacillus sp. UMB0728]